MKKGSSFFVSSTNKKGILIFLAVALFMVFLPRILDFFEPNEKFDISSEEIEKFKKESEKSRRRNFSLGHYYTSRKVKKYIAPPEKFDPNTYSVKDWMKLGLSEKQAAVILKFGKNGIYSNEQLKRIVVIPEELYLKIKDSTFYPMSKNYRDQKNEEVGKEFKKTIMVELNQASQAELEEIPGIGPFYAKNIIKYRDRLGGFFFKEQLLEVWKMDPEKYASIEQFVQVDKSKVNKLSLNNSSIEQLKTHPYLNWNIANSIIKIRAKKGSYSDIREIKESVLISEELFEKLKPYLTL